MHVACILATCQLMGASTNPFTFLIPTPLHLTRCRCTLALCICNQPRIAMLAHAEHACMHISCLLTTWQRMTDSARPLHPTSTTFSRQCTRTWHRAFVAKHAYQTNLIYIQHTISRYVHALRQCTFITGQIWQYWPCLPYIPTCRPCVCHVLTREGQRQPQAKA